jgi:hypothetical protein
VEPAFEIGGEQFEARLFNSRVAKLDVTVTLMGHVLVQVCQLLFGERRWRFEERRVDFVNTRLQSLMGAGLVTRESDGVFLGIDDRGVAFVAQTLLDQEEELVGRHGYGRPLGYRPIVAFGRRRPA